MSILNPSLTGSVRGFANGTLASVSLKDVLALLVQYGGALVAEAAKLSTLTGEQKKQAVDAAILAAYRKAKPFISAGWLTPVWWLLDPVIEAAIPQITEAVYQALKPYLEASK